MSYIVVDVESDDQSPAKGSMVCFGAVLVSTPIKVFYGQTYAHGPYRTEQARDNRMTRIQGGEVTPFNSLSSNPDTAIKEFKDEEVSRL